MRTFLKPIAALLTIGLVALAFAVGLAALPTRAADHLDAPAAAADGRLDINDVYAFKSGNNTVLIVTVNPLAGNLSPTTFHPNASYEILVDDDDADFKPDTKIELDFGKVKDGVQSVEIEIDGPNREVEAEGRTGRTIRISGGGKLRTGVFDDPFFFDLDAFKGTGGRTFCDSGTVNFFDTNGLAAGGLNVSAIVVELPSTWLGPNNIGVWARTVMGGNQIDRMGRPAINTVFIPPNPFEPTEPTMKDLFNATRPSDDAMWTAEVVDTLLLLGNSQTTADALAAVLLPDILTIDTSNPAGFLNGRRLADDVIDAELSLITGGGLPSDCVANDSAFTNTFPYLAPKN